jgi:hypothetical protein
MKLNESKAKSPDEKAAPDVREERGAEAPSAKIDFAKLDLTIEKVDERISPSETNVFDK